MIKRYLRGFGIAAVVVIVDLLTKRYAAHNFDGNPVDIIPGFLDFTYVENAGSALGVFKSGGELIAIAALVVTGAVLYAMAKPRPRLEFVALSLVLGGALGNLVDRFARGPGLLDGPVIDWINLWFIPTFNIADSAVTVAVGLMLVHAWRSK